MTKIITFSNNSLDCYAKSIQDFIEYLRNDINNQSQKCKNDKNYNQKQLEIISKIEENTKNDNFIIDYFNNNWDKKNINSRKSILEKIIEKKLFLQSFNSYILEKWLTNFYYGYDFLNKDDFFSEREKIVSNTGEKWKRFDEVLVSKDDSIRIYIEYKRNSICLCILSKTNEKDIIENEENIYQWLQKLAKIISLKNTFQNEEIAKVIWEKISDMFHFIKIESIWWNLQGKQYEERISQNFFTYLNEEINKRIVSNELFESYLETFSVD